MKKIKFFKYICIYLLLVPCFVEILLVVGVKAGLIEFKSIFIPPYMRQSNAQLVNDSSGSPIYINGLKWYGYGQAHYYREYDAKGFLTGDFQRIFNGKPNFFVLGDSNTEGLQVEREETFADLIDRRLADTNVINLSVGGTGTYAQSLRYKTIRALAKVDHVLLFFLPQNDVADNHYVFHKGGALPNMPYINSPKDLKSNLHKKNSLLRDIVKNLITARILYVGVKNYLNIYVTSASSKKIENSIFYRNSLFYYDVFNEPKNQIWQEAWKYTEDSILDLKKMTEEDEAEFTIVLTADSLQIHHYKNHLNGFDFVYPNIRMANFCEKYEIRCIDSLPYFKKFLNENNLSPPYFSFDNDGHYTKLGHSVMADFLLQELFNNT